MVIEKVLVLLVIFLIVSLVWNLIIRRVFLDAVTRTLYKSRDELRSWYCFLEEEKAKQQSFSYHFLERAINLLAANADGVNIWDYIRFERMSLSDTRQSVEFIAQVKRFYSEADSHIRKLDNRHTTLFVLVMLINSPIVFIFNILLFVFSSLVNILVGQTPADNIEKHVANIRKISHDEFAIVA